MLRNALILLFFHIGANAETVLTNPAATPVKPSETRPSSATAAPAPLLPKGRSEDLSKAFSPDEIKPFQYIPIDPLFWDKVQKAKATNNATELIVLGAAQEKKFKLTTPEGNEGRLALAMGLKAKGYSFGAFVIFLDLARDKIGSQIGEAALFELDDLVQNGYFEPDALDMLLNGNEFLNLHPYSQSFVSYFKYMYNLRFGFNKWAEPYKAQVLPGSYWDYQDRYWTAIGEIARDRVEKGYELIKTLYDDPKTPGAIKQQVQLQYARILFERGQFILANELYYKLGDLGVRERGRILLERAWSQYYVKEYSTALGILHTLSSSLFDSSVSFERYVLQMIIYRELCHYEAVDLTAKAFHKRFKPALKTIRKRKPLREDPILFSMAVLNKDLQSKANLIDDIRKEYKALKEYRYDQFPFYKPLLQEYLRYDKYLQAKLDQVLEDGARAAADDLLDAEEQVQFIDYTSKLDALRVIRPGEERDYKAERISYITFEKIYWPVDSEMWWDEVNDYRVLISSRCGKSSVEEEKREKEFK